MRYVLLAAGAALFAVAYLFGAGEVGTGGRDGAAEFVRAGNDLAAAACLAFAAGGSAALVAAALAGRPRP